MKGLILLLLAFCFYSSGFAQTYSIKGTLKEKEDNKPITGATVNLSDTSGKPVLNQLSSASGTFNLRGLTPRMYKLKISNVGFAPIDTIIPLNSNVDLGSVLLNRDATQLEEVVFQATPPPVRLKQDTLEYGAANFKVNPDANVQDMVKKMPGITIENGVVKAGGEDVRKVTIDGREFFGDDATAALRNLPAEVVDKIQVFDRLSDQAQVTGVDDGNTVKAINVVTKANMRNGQFGRVFAGYGTEERYSAGGNVTFMKENRRISLVGMTNNINQQNFSQEDLLGVTSQGQQGRGGWGGRGGGNFMVGQSPGITKTNAFGINYSNSPNKKLNISGSYFFNNTDNTNQSVLNRQLFANGDSSRIYAESSTSHSNNLNHRANMRIEYKMDSNNTFTITPNISYQNNSSESRTVGENFIRKTTLQSSTVNLQDRSGSAINLGNNALWRHNFAKKRRTLSVNIYTGFNERNNDNYLDGITRSDTRNDTTRQLSDQYNKTLNLNTNINFSEPISKKSQLQFTYNPSYSLNTNDRQTFRYDTAVKSYSIIDERLSTVFKNTLVTQRGGMSFNTGDRDRNFSVGLFYQEAKMNTDYTYPETFNIKRTFSNLLPEMSFRSKIGKKGNLRANYRVNVNAPNVNQLQNVINNTNPLFLSTGNPDLSQTAAHNAFARYNYTNTTKGLSFFANLGFTKTDDYISNASFIASEDSVISPSVVLFKGSQLTKPVNLDGYWSTRAFFTLGIPLKFIKTNLNLNTGYSHSRTPGIVNNISNFSKNNSVQLGLVLASNISEYVDFTVSYNSTFSSVRNSVQPNLDNDYITQNLGLDANMLTKNGWVLQNDLNYSSYNGLKDGFNQNFILWNLGIGKKFLKDQKGELKLTVFDLLKQNTSISRNITETYLEDVQTMVLQQYFMLTFSYRLRNFGKASLRSNRDSGQPGMERGRPDMGPGMYQRNFN